MKDLIKRNWRDVCILIAIHADIAAILSGIFIAYYIRSNAFDMPPLPFELLFALSIYFLTVFIVTASIVGAYRASFHENNRQQYFLTGKAYIISVLIILSSLTIFINDSYPRKFTFIFLLYLPFALVIVRIFLRYTIRYMQTKGYGIHNALLVGYDNGGLSIIHRFKYFPELGYCIKGVITKQSLPLEPIEIHGEMVSKYPIDDIESVIVQLDIDRLFIPSSSTIANGYVKVIDVCRRHRVKLKILSKDSDQLLKIAKVYDIAGITLHTTERIWIDLLKRIVKRFFDIVVATTLLFFFSPILLFVSIAIIVESGLPVFFRQKRTLIKGGKTFDFYKYRSMIRDADELKDSLFEKNESDGALFKMKDDPRVTNVGRFIRKYSIDELPQLFNVLKGDMSIVGPRPLPVSDYDNVNEPKEYWDLISERARVKPGITGLWQISGRSDIGFREMIWLDLYYAENYSLLFDLEILFATVPVVLFGRGAY